MFYVAPERPMSPADYPRGLVDVKQGLHDFSADCKPIIHTCPFLDLWVELGEPIHV